MSQTKLHVYTLSWMHISTSILCIPGARCSNKEWVNKHACVSSATATLLCAACEGEAAVAQQRVLLITLVLCREGMPDAVMELVVHLRAQPHL